MNALKSGIDAQSQIILGENIADLEALTAEYFDRFHPSTPEQRQYVDTLIRDDWQLRRLAKADAQIWEYQMQVVWKLNAADPFGQASCCGGNAFIHLQRRVDATERSYARALRELERLQSIENPPPSPAIGFVPQEVGQVPDLPSVEQAPDVPDQPAQEVPPPPSPADTLEP